MARYQKIIVRGMSRYMKDKRFIKAEDVPESVMAMFNEETEPAEMSTGQDSLRNKVCIFCGEPTNWSRYINGQIVYNCEEHYYSMSIGKIAQKIREIQSEGHEQTKESEQKV